MRLLLLLVLITVATLVSATFAYLNDGVITLNLAFAVVTTRMGPAFVGALTVGWIFGLLSSLGLVLKLANDRRILRRRLKIAEIQAAGSGSLPVQDAG